MGIFMHVSVDKGQAVRPLDKVNVERHHRSMLISPNFYAPILGLALRVATLEQALAQRVHVVRLYALPIPVARVTAHKSAMELLRGRKVLQS